MLTVKLYPGLPGIGLAVMRELTGRDEMELAPAGESRSATIGFMSRLLITADGGLPAARAVELAVPDIDRMAISLTRVLFGDKIMGQTTCSTCGEDFEFSLSLGRLLDGTDEERLDGVEGPDDRNVFRLSDGCKFRLPRLDDLDFVNAAREESTAELAKCLVVDPPAGGPTPEVLEAVDRAIDRIGGSLMPELDAACPACEGANVVRFDPCRFLLELLAGERLLLFREVHLIARGYGWSRREILDLAREERRQYVRFLQRDLASVKGVA